ncbi:MAG: peptide transporter [Candidatus Latescibacteria bacterium]|nr:peptide transporter [Candidatus Latescibacterota bacterium]
MAVPEERLTDDLAATEVVLEEEAYQPGFNMKTVWACLFVGFVMLPGSIYLSLVTGGSTGAADWVTVILFLEIAKRSFIRMSRQEIMILYWAAAGLAAAGVSGGPFAALIWNQYFVQSPAATGIAEYIPTWVVPQRGSEALALRSFLHLDWLKSIVVLSLTTILSSVNGLSLGYALFRVTNDVERLPFPLAPVAAGGATALAETSNKREGWRWRAFSIGSVIGVVWGLVYVVIPILSSTFLVTTVQILPIPFIDFTVSVKSFLPATTVGLGTNLGLLLTGFVLPFWVVVGMFASAAASAIVVNPVLYHAGILHTWSPGMSMIPTGIANNIDFWLSFTIGTSVVVALIGIGATIRALIHSIRERRLSGEQSAMPPPPPGRGDIRVGTALLIWGVSTAGYVILVRMLVPEFPVWITAIFGFIWTPIFSYISARMIGITGGPGTAAFPYVREASFYLSGYKGVAVWFAPIPMFDQGGTASTFKQLELTKTTFGSYVKLNALTLGLMFICSFLFYSLIWKLGPIPSAAFPFIQKMWPFQATMNSIWYKSTMPGASNFLLEVIKVKYVIAGLGIAGGAYALISLLGAPTILFYGLVAGMGAGFTDSFPTFAGALLGRYYFAKRFGQEKWMSYVPIVAAGYGAGLGLIGMIAIAIALISKAISQIVY